MNKLKMMLVGALAAAGAWCAEAELVNYVDTDGTISNCTAAVKSADRTDALVRADCP